MSVCFFGFSFLTEQITSDNITFISQNKNSVDFKENQETSLYKRGYKRGRVE